MSDDVQMMDSQGKQAAVPAPAEVAVAPNLLRPLMSVRLGRAQKSLCAETAWVWQRARLLCGQGE